MKRTLPPTTKEAILLLHRIGLRSTDIARYFEVTPPTIHYHTRVDPNPKYTIKEVLELLGFDTNQIVLPSEHSTMVEELSRKAA